MYQKALAALLLALPCTAQQPSPAVPPQQPDKNVAAATKPVWVETPSQQLDVLAGATEVVGTFAFANPSDKAVEFREVNVSCTCSSSTFRVGDRTFVVIPKPRQMLEVLQSEEGEKRVPITAIPIGPRQRGEVDMHMTVQSSGESKAVSMDIHTTDPAWPMIHLSIQAVGQRALIVEPEEIDLGTMEPRAKKEFEVKVRSKVLKDFAILEGSKLPPNVTATWEKEMVNGSAVWTVRGTYTAVDQKAPGEIQSDAAILKFLTDAGNEKSFNVRLNAKIGRAVEVVPTFVSFGQIRIGTKRTESIRFTRADGKATSILAARFENLSLPERFVSASIRMDGGVAIVDVSIAEDAPRGLVRGDLVVDLDHPTVAQQRVLFNGFAR